MNIEGNRYLIIAISVFLLLSLALFLFFKFFLFGQIPQDSVINPIKKIATSSNGQIRKEIPEPSVKIKRYILDGEVTAINGVELSITLQRLFAGDNGNYLDTDNKVVRVSSSTELVIGKFVNNKYTEVPAKLSDIIVGVKLTFYSAQNIKVMPIFSPYKIIINQVKK